jgi:DNA repair protein RAD7
MEHLLATNIELQSLSLHGANLIDDENWEEFLNKKGPYLKSLKVYFTDRYFGDEQLELLATSCPSLERLKLCHNQRLTASGIKHIAHFQKLEHLSLQLYMDSESEPYITVLDSIGSHLRTLSLSTVHYIEDGVLKAIHDNCKVLSKLRITDNEVLSDQAFAELFTAWRNSPLTYVDFNKCRYVDASKPRENPDGIGFGSLGFEALMAHSGSHIRYLRIDACRHISLETFERVFAPGKQYPELKDFDISFCQSVNDFVVGSIFRACPKMKTLTVFGNFGVKDVVVPKGRILIGVPNAMGMKIEGTEDGEGRII